LLDYDRIHSIEVYNIVLTGLSPEWLVILDRKNFKLYVGSQAITRK